MNITLWLTISPLILIIIGVVLFRKSLGKRFVDNGIAATGNTYSDSDYNKKAKYAGWAFVGFAIGLFGGAYTLAIKLAPPILYNEMIEQLPYAVVVFMIGIFMFSMNLFSTAKIKPVKSEV